MSAQSRRSATAAASDATTSSPSAGSKSGFDSAHASAANDAAAASAMTDAASSSTPPLVPASAPSFDAAASLSPAVADASARKRAKRTNADAAASSAAAATAPPSRWASLYSDALHSILQFATLKDFNRVVRVSRRWCEAVTTMPSIQATSSMGNALALPISRAQSRHGHGQLFGDRLRSRLARHVVAFQLTTVYPSISHLQVIAERMPWLQKLECKPTTSQPFAAVIVQLRELRTLEMPLARLQPKDANAVIAAISHLPKLEELQFGLARAGITDVNFDPLSALHSLRTLELQSDQPYVPASDAQIAQLRSLASVTKLYAWCQNDDAGYFVRLLQPGHPFEQWREFAHQYRGVGCAAVTAPLAPLLGSLSSVAKLWATMKCSDFSFLPQMRQLTSLYVTCAAPVQSTEMLDAMSQCTGLRRLRLENCNEVTSAHLEKLLPSFPQLLAVSVVKCSMVDSLRWLAIPALSASLTGVTLLDLPLCLPSEVSHLFSLRALTTMCVLRLAGPVSKEIRDEIKQRWPELSLWGV